MERVRDRGFHELQEPPQLVIRDTSPTSATALQTPATGTSPVSGNTLEGALNKYNFKKLIYILLFSTIMIMLSSVVTYYAFRDDFGEKDTTFMDHLYFAITTYTTVGYGDLSPKTQGARAFISVTIFLKWLGIFIISTLK